MKWSFSHASIVPQHPLLPLWKCDTITSMVDDEHFQKLRELYPGKTDEELEIISDNLDRYLVVILRIYDRISLDPEAYQRLRDDLAQLCAEGPDDDEEFESPTQLPLF